MDIEAVRRQLAHLGELLDDPDEDLIAYLGAIIHFALLELPTCVGVSVTVVDGDVPYTVTATGPQTRVVDAAQYVSDGPCLATAAHGDLTEVPDVLDEHRWGLYARAAAAEGVQSSLSLPLLFEHEIIGAVNFYGGTPQTFDDRAHMLAELISGHAAYAMRDADLSLRTRELAAATDVAAEALGSPDDAVEQAVGLLMQLQDIKARPARGRMHSAADRAGIDASTLARALLELTAPPPAA